MTLALSFLLSSLTAAWPSLFGGWTGIANVPSLGSTFLGIDVSLTKPISGFIVVTILCGFVVSGFRWILNSQFGLLVDGLKDNEERLQYLGIDVAKVKLAIFAISAGVAGFAGILYSAQSGYVAPELIGVTFSTEVIIFVAVGGRGTLVGAILGTIIVRGIGYWLGGVIIELLAAFHGYPFHHYSLICKGWNHWTHDAFVAFGYERYVETT